MNDKMSLYLSGLIDVENLDLTYNWRNEAIEYFKHYDVKIYNPLRNKMLDKKPIFDFNEIVDRDIYDLQKSDIILVNFIVDEKIKKIAFGTPMEIALAYWLRKPIIFVSNDENVRRHYWVQRMSTKIFKEINQAMAYIVQNYIILEGENLCINVENKSCQEKQ